MLSARLVSRVIRSQSSRASFAALGAARGSVSPRIIPNEVSSFPEVHTPLCGISPPKNRSFAASASTDAAPALSEVVEEELNYERSTEGTNEVRNQLLHLQPLSCLACVAGRKKLSLNLSAYTKQFQDYLPVAGIEFT